MGTLGRLTADQLDLARDTFDFTQSITDTLGDLGTPADGFDSYLNETGILLSAVGDPGSSLDDDVNLAASIGGSIDPMSLQADALSLPASLAAGDAILGDASALASGVSEPAPPSSAPTAPSPSNDCMHRTNQYGLSTAGAFPGVKIDWRNTFQILRVQDGPCTYSAAPAAAPGATALPKIVSFTLLTGDASVWQLGHHTAHASDGSPFDVIDIGITPKVQALPRTPPRANLAGATNPTPAPTQASSHFDATAQLVMSSPARTWTVVMSVDCIP